MNVLVIGKGGREHALVRALYHSHSVTEVHAVPGNVGMSREAVCHNLATNDHQAIAQLIARTAIDFVVIGPEVELEEGLSDFLRNRNIRVFAPSKAAAQLETSKIFSKKFMQQAGVLTAKFEAIDSVEGCLSAAKEFTPPYVLKADGLAAGKGVFICSDLDELKNAATDLFENKKLGTAGDRAILEQYAPGWELSFLVLTDGKNYEALPLMQDHKRLGEGDTGPNTGGMGVAGPLKIDDQLRRDIEFKILEPSVAELYKQDLLYYGVLYVGVMVTEDGPLVLEYNTRFGDPEAQAILPLLHGDWGRTLLAVSQGEVPDLKWKPLASACVVLAAEGYPDSPKKGVSIGGDAWTEGNSSYFLHAGTGRDENGELITNGGRVLNAVALGADIDEALKNAYAQAEKVTWPGLQMRKDIGQKILSGELK